MTIEELKQAIKDSNAKYKTFSVEEYDSQEFAEFQKKAKQLRMEFGGLEITDQNDIFNWLISNDF